MVTEARSNPDEQKYIVWAETILNVDNAFKNWRRIERRSICMRASKIERPIRNRTKVTHHQTSASKTYVMINTVILSYIFDYL